ncbi:type II secretion system F family protein [Lachnospira multipara]|uniref:Type IV pilus assembly protein PilC n=1 Tax=Lachnospira multipara TaxID=28051 RepID=A0A1H5URX3_9FIRM|nr:type II secretion system F family protein [Lachnospira multipara]MBQ2472913.1 type II secretion system F family protein [Lachnospira sp.]SEF77789.1 type IV pilus assembly protein PilC [Lachnospira multipara]
METYLYQAITSEGIEKKGSIKAENEREAQLRIRETGLIPISVSRQNFLNKDIELSFLKGKVKQRDMAVFCRQFSSIIKAGISIVSALEMLEEQTEDSSLKEGIKRARAGVEKGESLADALREDKIFPSILIEMIKAGESSGSLEKSLDRMAIQFEKEAKLKGIIKKAMMYPIVLLIVMIGILVVMLTFVIPNFVTMFEDLNTSLPTSTKLIIGLSDLFRNYWLLLVVLVAFLIFLYKIYKASDGGRHKIDGLKLKLPIFGKLAVKTACASISRTLATLIQSGMPLISALDITAQTMPNIHYKDALIKMKGGVALGIPLSSQMKTMDIFPAMLTHMVGIGEQTGNMEEMLSNSANYYEEEVEITTTSLTALLEPVIIIIMALLVILLIAAIYQPMIQLYNSI